MSKRVVELVRVSTEGQASEDRAGIPAQRAVNRRTAAQQGLEIVQTIEITDVSGTAVLRSRGMQELLRLTRVARHSRRCRQGVQSPYAPRELQRLCPPATLHRHPDNSLPA